MRHEAEIPALDSEESINPEQSGDARLLPLSQRVNFQEIAHRLSEGELIRDIAQSYGVTRTAISQYVRRHGNKQQWAEAREESIAARLERTAKEIETAPDLLSLSRAREHLRLWTWRAERELPHLYGQRTHTTVEVGPDLANILDRAQSRAERVVSEQHAAPLLPDVSASSQISDAQVVDDK